MRFNEKGQVEKQQHILIRFGRLLIPHYPHILAMLASTGLFVLFSTAAYWLAASFLTALFQGTLEATQDGGGLNGLLKQWTALLLVGQTPQATLARAAIAIVIAFFGKNLFGYLQLFYISHVEQRVIKELRDRLFSHLLSQDLAFFQRERRGHLISALLNDVEQLNSALNKSFTKLVRDPLNALLLLVLLFAVSWKLTLAAIVVVPALGWTVQLLSRRIKLHATQVQELFARMTGHLQETFSGIRVVKAFVNEPFEIDRFRTHTASHYGSSFAQERLRRLVIPLNEVVGILIVSAILYLGGELVLVRGAIPSEDFIRFLVLLFALLNPLLSLTNLVANVRVAEASGSRVFRLLDTRPEVTAPSRPVKIKYDKELRIEKVSFRYTSDTPLVLEEIDLSIPRGEHLAIVGRSGSGKSTLLNLLPRFMDPSSGRITLDGLSLTALDPHELRRLFGVVTQQIVLFHDTIRANIAYGLGDVAQEAIEAAARAAHAHDFITELPEGYETIVGEQGSLFSGGQRQRISIARAILRDPQIVLLDEATSALDPESEEAVNDAIGGLTAGRTVITVTHRIATIRHADRIAVLEKGRLIDIGAHEELLGRCEVYRHLAHQQHLAAAELSGGDE